MPTVFEPTTVNGPSSHGLVIGMPDSANVATSRSGKLAASDACVTTNKAPNSTSRCQLIKPRMRRVESLRG